MCWVTERYAPILDEMIISDIKTYVVYTFYDEDRQPIYVGKTINFIDRYDWHQRKPYYAEIKYIGFRKYNNRAEMDLAEIFQIQTKQPKYNAKDKNSGELKMISFQDFSVEVIFLRSRVNEWLYERSTE